MYVFIARLYSKIAGLGTPKKAGYPAMISKRWTIYRACTVFIRYTDLLYFSNIYLLSIYKMDNL